MSAERIRRLDVEMETENVRVLAGRSIIDNYTLGSGALHDLNVMQPNR